MKLFTHSYKVTVFYEGKFCWRNHGWLEKGINDYRKDKIFDLFIIAVLAISIIF